MPDRKDRWIAWYIGVLERLVENRDTGQIERVYGWMTGKLQRSHRHYRIVYDYYYEAMKAVGE